MPTWVKPYRIRRSSKIVSYAVRQNHTLLETCGEVCYLLRRFTRANAVFQKNERRVSTITKTVSSYSVDSDTGLYRALLWQDGDDIKQYPDIQISTCTVQTTGGPGEVWEPAVDKYSFIPGANQIAYDIYQDDVLSDGTEIPDAVYAVFNTPFSMSNLSIFTFGTISPLVKYEGMQPKRDDYEYYKRSLFGFEQWKNSTIRVRGKVTPHAFLLAFPNVLSDFQLSDAGFLQYVTGPWFTSPPPYSPKILEHDVVIRANDNMRFQVTDYTPTYIENLLLMQSFTLNELDPRSSIYDITIETT